MTDDIHLTFADLDGVDPGAVTVPAAVARHGHDTEGVQAAPEDVQASPENVQAAPEGVQAVPKNVQAAPEDVQATPELSQEDIDAERFLTEQEEKKARQSDDDDFDLAFASGPSPEVREDPSPQVHSPTNEMDKSNGKVSPLSKETLNVSRADDVNASTPEFSDSTLSRGHEATTPTTPTKTTSLLRHAAQNEAYRADTSMAFVLHLERTVVECLDHPDVIISAGQTTIEEPSLPSTELVMRVPIDASDLSYAGADHARAQWDAVPSTGNENELSEGEDEMDAIGGGSGDGAGRLSSAEIIDYVKALEHFRHGNMERFKSTIRPVILGSGWKGIKRRLLSKRLKRELVKERDFVFCVAADPFDNNEESHLRMLRTIHAKLTGSKFACSRYGNHWEEIGFQGTDPSTDLRATGMLSLLMLVYLVTTSRTQGVARDIYRLSRHETQNFPFCLMSINVTRIILQLLREARLNKLCNREKSVLDVVNLLYVASYLHLYQVWKREHKTIGDSGLVLQDLEQYVRKDPKVVIRNLESYLQSQQQDRTNSSVRVHDATKSQPVSSSSFSGVVEMASERSPCD